MDVSTGTFIYDGPASRETALGRFCKNVFGWKIQKQGARKIQAEKLKCSNTDLFTEYGRGRIDTRKPSKVTISSSRTTFMSDE